MNRENPRRPTPQNRPFIFAGDDLTRLIDQSQRPCDYDCYDCLRRGPVTFLTKPAALRFAFTFYSTHEIYSQFNGQHIVTWVAAEERWESDEIEIECDGDDGQFIFSLQGVDLPYTLLPGGVQLALQRVGGTGCPEFLQVNWFNVNRFDGLCNNTFRAESTGAGTSRAFLAMYDTSQMCELCVEPLLLETTCGDRTYPASFAFIPDPDTETKLPEMPCVFSGALVSGLCDQWVILEVDTPSTNECACHWDVAFPSANGAPEWQGCDISGVNLGTRYELDVCDDADQLSLTIPTLPVAQPSPDHYLILFRITHGYAGDRYGALHAYAWWNPDDDPFPDPLVVEVYDLEGIPDYFCDFKVAVNDFITLYPT